MLIGKGSKLLMIGDSVTDAERKRPVGEGRGADIGKSYVAIVNALLNSACPQEQIRVVNMGISGDTSRSLLQRGEGQSQCECQAHMKPPAPWHLR